MATVLLGTMIIGLGAGIKIRSNKKKYLDKKRLDISMKLALNKRGEFLKELKESNKKIE